MTPSRRRILHRDIKLIHSSRAKIRKLCSTRNPVPRITTCFRSWRTRMVSKTSSETAIRTLSLVKTRCPSETSPSCMRRPLAPRRAMTKTSSKAFQPLICQTLASLIRKPRITASTLHRCSLTTLNSRNRLRTKQGSWS